MARSIRTDFTGEIKKGCLDNGGAVSVDGVHLKVNGKYLYDFTVHFTCVKQKDVHELHVFEVKNKTILLVESMLFRNAINVHEKLKIALLQKYQKSLDTFLKDLKW